MFPLVRLRLVTSPDSTGSLPTAKTIGTVEVTAFAASSEDDFEKAFAMRAEQRTDALVVSADPFFISHRERLVLVAARFALPTIYFARDFAAAGGLMSYGSNFSDAFRQAGNYVLPKIASVALLVNPNNTNAQPAG
jgi:putative ABC transport system substrate-binding protein